ncbi:hypothetical protein SISSUDRAFT_1062109 [Sistotremastrum suecicum HHB10207 ss-3]|uniref:Sucraseferredoxin-like protein n=1 Tax=Sistotremastrum suecicum HHB10207 ss-3 TaxID=1314776 RepID=A0A166D978_9AGAM|nr:hypothetical protein SISSUDRAFT_1062109 [Sistotremastrum suecicum HHB10207 ss-3]
MPPQLARNLIARRLASTSAAQTAATDAVETIAGTVPFHSSYLFLHLRNSISELPSKPQSRLLNMIRSRALDWGCLVNLCHSIDDEAYNINKVALRSGGDTDLLEGCKATLYTPSAGNVGLEIDDLQENNVEEKLATIAPLFGVNPKSPVPGTVKSDSDVQLYVCTHGSRDCRCGDEGGRVLRAIRDHLRSRDSSLKVACNETAHVGGHKYAANVLVFPHGDWYGNLKPEHVPTFLDTVLAASPSKRSYEPPDHPLSSFWRGRMGLSKSQQIDLVS